MSPTAEHVLQTALALPAAEQVEVIEALIAELDQADPQPLDEACMAEVRRRSADYDAGNVTPIPWAEVRDHTRGEGASRG
jgi:putative addiction module component (TIGR02574 family)